MELQRVVPGSAFSAEPFAPVTGAALGVHDGDNPHAIRFVQINQRVRKLAGQRALCRWTETEETFGLAANLADEPFNFIVERLPSSGVMAA